MGGACSTHGRGEKYIQKFGQKPEANDDLGIDRRIILEWI
jgi:hypothetical protein